ncbi:hypothetical protein RI129_011690 [Pyrocoelia pectoralis]|uniref:Uncharacterized protein n=1 Tax=Pyrocoelia pectoralis TaxID=417401 RepID=A0AAN7V4W9_9COLE
MQCCFNAIGKKSNFNSWGEGFTIRENLSAKIQEKFGPNTMVVLAAQNYENVKDTQSSFKNVLEIYDVKVECTIYEIQQLFTALDVFRLIDLVWMSLTSALAVFENEIEANAVFNRNCRLFKSRKLEDGSDLAILSAVNLAWPRNQRSVFSIQVDELPPWEPPLCQSTRIHSQMHTSEMYQKYLPNQMRNSKTKMNESRFTHTELEDIPEEPEELLESQTITDAGDSFVIENPYNYL